MRALTASKPHAHQAHRVGGSPQRPAGPRGAGKKPGPTLHDLLDRVQTMAEHLERLATAVGQRSHASGEDPDLAAKREEFDRQTAIRVEEQRQVNVLREIAMQQVKRDHENLSAWIKMI